jgi:hypothetical protein
MPVSSFQDYIAKRGSVPPNAMGEAAVALAERTGWPVFPCDALKQPLTSHGFKDATTDPVAIRRMFSGTAAVMIGVPCGATTQLIVVDVDVKDSRQGMDWLNANSHRMPQTYTIKTASGGLHIYLRHFGERVKNSQSKVAPGIDVRGDGGYVIVPPSPGYQVADDAPIADCPDWLIPSLWQPAPAPLPPAPKQSRILDGGSAYGLTALERECDAIRSARDGEKHATVNKAAYSIGGLVSNGELQERPAFAALSSALNAIRSACKSFPAAQKTLRAAFDAGMGKPRPAPERPLPPEASPLALKLMARATAPIAPLAISSDLMDVDGALGMFVEHCNATAISPQPFLALAAGICAIGVLAGRRYRTKTNLRTNIYAVGIADSGGGKDHARKQIKQVMSHAGLTRYMGGEDIASGAAMLTALHRHPAILFQIDEFGDWLQGVLGKQASAHRKQIAERLKTLYSSADSYISGTEYADQTNRGRPKEDIQEPHACLYGTTTPGQFWQAIAGASMHDGLLARVMIFVSANSYPDETDPQGSPPSEQLIAAFKAIANGAEASSTANLVMVSSAKPEPYLVDASPEAERALKTLRRDQIAMQRAAEGTYVTAIAARWAENAAKLALVRAVSRDPAWPTISESDVAWGRALSKHCIDTLLQDADRHVADSEYEARLNRAREIIRKHGPITERDMIRKGFKLPARDRAEILSTLVAGGIVFEVASKSEGAGRPTIRFVASDTINFVTSEKSASD